MSKIRSPANLTLRDNPTYFDFQACWGHTKHIGGALSTDVLGEMCHVGPGSTVLLVGCGAGLSAVYLVRSTGCRLVGVDLLENMIAWSRYRAEEAGIVERAVFGVADAQDLPFADDSFDAVISESVNVFVPDRPRAAREYRRVVKPGGYVGLNEAIWIEPPPAELSAQVQDVLAGGKLELPHVWSDLLTGAGLVDVVSKTYATDLRRESRSQLKLIARGQYAGILWRMLSLVYRDRSARQFVKQSFSIPRGVGGLLHVMGHGLYAGRKPLLNEVAPL